MKLINLPNIITCCNILCGCLAIYFGMQGQVDFACLSIVAGAIFDFFDGMTARALGISGPIGKELDSLADMVSFGVAPSVLAYQIAQVINGGEPNVYDFLISMIIAAFSGLRLAKFNCDERQLLSFIGLPTPANALFWIGLTYVVRIPAISDFYRSNIETSFTLWGILVLFTSFMLISEVPMFSLKIKPGHMSFKENRVRYLFVAFTLILFFVFGIMGQLAASLAAIILLYIIVCIIGSIKKA